MTKDAQRAATDDAYAQVLKQWIAIAEMRSEIDVLLRGAAGEPAVFVGDFIGLCRDTLRARSETGAMEFADNTATKAIVSASTPKEGEIEENLTEIEEAIWNATGSALLSGEKAGAADKSIIYRSLCAAGNKVAYVRELLTARSSTALPEPAKDLQEANEIIEILRGELARVAIAVGRTKDGTGYDLDWFALHKDIPAPRSAIAPKVREVLDSFAHHQCYACGWHLEGGQDSGCMPFNCSMRPSEEHPMHARWKERALEMEAVRKWASTPIAPMDSRSDGA